MDLARIRAALSPSLRRRKRRYRAVFETEDGRWVLQDLARTARLDVQVFQPGNPDVSAFNDGGRTLLLHILTVLDEDVEAMVRRIIQERGHGEEADDE